MTTPYNNVMDNLQHHPVVASFISVGCVMFSLIIKATALILPIMEIHIAPIVMESAQLLAYIAAIAAGVISVLGFIKKRKKEADGKG